MTYSQLKHLNSIYEFYRKLNFLFEISKKIIGNLGKIFVVMCASKDQFSILVKTIENIIFFHITDDKIIFPLTELKKLTASVEIIYMYVSSNTLNTRRWISPAEIWMIEIHQWINKIKYISYVIRVRRQFIILKEKQPSPAARSARWNWKLKRVTIKEIWRASLTFLAGSLRHSVKYYFNFNFLT